MGRFTDVMRQEEAIEDSLKLAQAKQDSSMRALEEIRIEKARRDAVIAAEEEGEIDYTYGIFEDERGIKHAEREVTGGRLFSEGTKGEEPMFKLAGGFIPVPNPGMNRIALNQPSSYIEKDELGYLSGGFEAPPSSLLTGDAITKALNILQGKSGSK